MHNRAPNWVREANHAPAPVTRADRPEGRVPAFAPHELTQLLLRAQPQRWRLAPTKNKVHLPDGSPPRYVKRRNGLSPRRGEFNRRIQIINDGFHGRDCLLKRSNLRNLKTGYRILASS